MFHGNPAPGAPGPGAGFFKKNLRLFLKKLCFVLENIMKNHQFFHEKKINFTILARAKSSRTFGTHLRIPQTSIKA